VQSAANNVAGSGVQINRDFSKTRFFDEGHVIIGSPDEVAEKLREVAVQLNVGNILLLLHFGNMKRDLVEYNTTLFATKVLPQIKDLFEDEWEHKWWPNPLPRAARVQTRMGLAAAQ
jgi:hypothetical protein